MIEMENGELCKEGLNGKNMSKLFPLVNWNNFDGTERKKRK